MINTFCSNCNKKIKTFNYKIKKTKNLFCSNICKFKFRPIFKNKKILEDLYIKQKLSSVKIAKLYNITSSCVLLNLKKFKINTRKPKDFPKGKNSPYYGIKRPYVSKALLGKNNHNYVHGNGNKKYPSKFNKQLKLKIRKRDNFRCQYCNLKEKNYYRNLDIHHIDYNKENCNEDNLIT